MTGIPRAIGLGVVLGVLLSACSRIVPVLVFVPLKHDLSAWANDDQVCIALPGRDQLYGVKQRCMPMQAIRAYILSAQSANEP